MLRFRSGVSLDFKHAFDCVDLALKKGTFEEVLPAPCKIWSRLLLFQWQTSSRWVGYGSCLHSASFKSSCGIPQGDPCSPLVLAVHEQVCQAIGEQNMMMCIYLDDRTIIADSKERVELAKTAWSDFAKQWSHDAFHKAFWEGSEGQASAKQTESGQEHPLWFLMSISCENTFLVIFPDKETRH